MKIQEGFNLSSAFPSPLMNCVLLGAIWPPLDSPPKFHLIFLLKIRLYLSLYLYLYLSDELRPAVCNLANTSFTSRSSLDYSSSKKYKKYQRSFESCKLVCYAAHYSCLLRCTLHLFVTLHVKVFVTLHVTSVAKEYAVCVSYSPSNPQTAVLYCIFICICLCICICICLMNCVLLSKQYEVCVGYSPSNPQTAVPTRKLPH